MQWICKKCAQTYTTNGGKPSGGNCQKDKNGKMQPHSWIKK